MDASDVSLDQILPSISYFILYDILLMFDNIHPSFCKFVISNSHCVKHEGRISLHKWSMFCFLTFTPSLVLKGVQGL